MGWDDYSLKDPTFCQPLRVMQGLVSALAERKFPIIPGAYSSAVHSSAAYYEGEMNRMLTGQANVEYPFKLANRVGTNKIGIFAYQFDYQLRNDIFFWGKYCDQNGDVYLSVDDLASRATGSALISAAVFENCLDVKWAKQRQQMLEALRYLKHENSGGDPRLLTMQIYKNDSSHYPFNSVQAAYDDITSWSQSSFVSSGYPARVYYQYTNWTQYNVDSAYEIERMYEVVGDGMYAGGLMFPNSGSLLFDAVEPEYGWGANQYKFNPLNATNVSSGANVLPMQDFIVNSSQRYGSAIFASWGHGSADLSNESCSEDDGYICTGWQMQNVRIIYDYNSQFEFNQS